MEAPGPPPHPQMLQDAEHLKLLAIFHYVLAGLQVLFGCFFIIYIVMGGFMLSGGMGSGTASSPAPPKELGWFFILIGGFAILLSWGMAVGHFLAGRWISSRQNWMFCFVVACIGCINVPLGTALGIFTILVMQRPTVKQIFGRPLPGTYLNS